MRRSAVVLGIVWLIGLTLVVSAPSRSLTAVGLGLLLPGAGFTLTGSWLLFAVSLVLFALAFVVFWLFSPIWLPALVWAAATGLAALQSGSGTVDAVRVAVPLVLLVAAIAGMGARRWALRRQRQVVEQRNAILADRTWRPPLGAATGKLLAPLTDSQLAAMRYVLDLALQPIERFDGFTTFDQFREAGWRYQLNPITWSLAMAQASRIPAFTGYVAEAQRNSVLKMLDPRVWTYWRYENLIGNLRWAPDPIANENVMLSGYYAAQIGAYETVTGDRTFHEPGSLTFDDGKHRYEYDFGRIVDRLMENFHGSRFCMFPCEPNWIYPRCNQMALVGVLFYDRLTGANRADLIREKFDEATIREFSRPDDRVLNMRSSRLGFGMPGMSTSVMTDADSVFCISPLLPEVAARRWEFLRHENLSVRADGRLDISGLTVFDRIDAGNYKLGTKVWTLATLMTAAAEMGDEEIRVAALNSLDADYSPTIHNGALHIDGSTFANVFAAVGRFAAPRGWHDLVNYGQPPNYIDSPRLTFAPYPDALVAFAASDGNDLDVEIVPGSGPARVELEVDRLRANADYAAAGCIDTVIRSDALGQARLICDLDGRRRITLRPLT